MSITEYAFSVDDFQNPKLIKGPEAIAKVLVHLLLLEPGLIQSHPDMGVGLVSRYRFSTEDSVPDLQNDYLRQIEKYLPALQGTRVNVTMRDHKIYITAEFENVLYGVSFDQSTSKVESNYSSLADL